MIPHEQHLGRQESGIIRVVRAYFKHLPAFGVELVNPGEPYDLKAVHAGTAPDASVCHGHGLYWSADYSAAAWEWKANQSVIQAMRAAREVTVPSRWVAETFQRDMRFTPHVVPHGIAWDEWQGIEPAGQGYVLWNKNRSADVCDPTPMEKLAARFAELPFLTTFSTSLATPNVKTIGLKPHQAMQNIIAGAAVYLSTTKETFGIGTLEALACGVPVLGFAHGSNLDLVEHGQTGYLAQPGNIDDLAQGLSWCLENRARLSDNARESARKWTWEAACQQVAGIYELAMQDDDSRPLQVGSVAELGRPVVSVIVPCHDKAGTIVRAIESIKAQTANNLECLVVDDASSDGSERVIRDAIAGDVRFHFERVEFRNVALVRNHAAAQARAPFLCFLDGDDWLDERFLEACLPALLADRSLGVTYTGLTSHEPNNRTSISPWPGEWNFDRQLEHFNQIPTCSIIRKKAFDRIGGQRARYSAGRGAGSEDAEMYTRLGAYGWSAKKVTAAGLFHYSWKSGIVTGDPEYKEADWLGWHSWVKDGQHPFASLATPRRFSHPVRQYDEPTISVVIPVGPGHETTVIDALDSLEAQTFRKWEVIVVWDGARRDDEDFQRLLTAYPYIRWVHNQQTMGAGYSRNRGAKIARAPFVVFLDADDWLYPKALERMLAAWDDQEAVIFTDYVGKAIVDDPRRLAPNLQERLYSWDQKTQQAIIGYRSANFEPERAQRQPEDGQPYHWALVTCLIPKAWHDAIGGFDEEMKTWEDVDYHWRMAMAGKCYHRLAEELVVYRFQTGQRRQLGLQEHTRLVEYLRAKYRSIDIVGCNCGGNGRQATKAASNGGGAGLAAVARSNGGSDMAGNDLVMIVYTHPNRGRHRVIGSSTRTDYGYRKGGEQFLVKAEDARTQSHIFRPVEQMRAAAPTGVKPLPPVPVPIGTVAPEPAPDEIAPSFEPPEAGAAETETAAGLDLQALPGVSKTLAKKLKSKGIQTADDILALGPEGLVELGAAPSKALIIIQSVEELQRMAAQA